MIRRKLFGKSLAFFVSLLGAVLLTVACSTSQGETSTGSGSTPTPTSTTSGGGGGKYDDNGNPVATYHISFYTGDGATQVKTMMGLQAGDTIVAPETPRLAYNTFDGWYTDYGTWEHKFDFETTKMPASNLCLYAKWVSSISDDSLSEYETKLEQESQEGHLYIHYLRFNNNPEDYKALNLWVWPYQFTGRVFEWNSDASGEVMVDDIAGATCDIDLTKVYSDAGKEGTESMKFLKTAGNYQAGDIKEENNYMNAQIGFLIVYKDSKDSGTHWRSDGNADQFIQIKDALWDNGSIHIFCVQDNVSDYVTHISDQKEIVNPYADDDGTHVSKGGVNSSAVLPVKHGTQIFDTVTGVGYQIMVSSFADSDGDGMGDIRGIIENFDYIEKLNVNTLWLTPIQLSDSYHGYDIIDYKVVDPKFGTTGKTDLAAQQAALDDYKELLTLCHSKGIKVIMDLVLNHTSTNNVWFQNSAKMIVGEDGTEYRNFYQWRNHEVETNLSKDWYPYSEYAYSYYGKFSPSMPELNYDYQGTRDAIVDVALYWLGILGNGKGVDGFRIDAVKHIYMADEVTPSSSDIIISDYDTATDSDYSSNLTKNINFFTEFANRIKDEYPACYLVGENFDGQAYNVAPYYTAYDGMLDFYMYYELGKLATYPSSANSLAGGNQSSDGSVPKGSNTSILRGGEWDYEAILGTQQAYSMYGLTGSSGSGNNDVVGSTFTSNHDLPRLMNNVLRIYNGAEWTAGTVTKENAAWAERSAKAIIATMMCLPGISWIYYGDELGMSSNYGDGEDKTSPHVDRQYRQPFKWTTADKASGGSKYITNFSISGDTTLYVNWDSYNKTLKGVDEQDTDTSSFLNYVRKWTNLKSTDDVIRFGDYKYKKIEWNPGNVEQSLFSFTRTYGNTTYWIVTNFTEYDYTNLNIFGNYEIIEASAGANHQTLPAGGTIVLKIS